MSKRPVLLLTVLALFSLLAAWSSRLKEPVSFENNGRRPPVETNIGVTPEGHERVVTFYGPPLHIDRILPSMQGPSRTEWMSLQAGSKELNWIVGARAVMVKPDSDDRVEQEYMCHTNLAIVSPTAHIQRHLGIEFNDGYLFTISQGQEEVRLPEGFGIPILGETAIKAGMQVLNLNKVPSQPFDVRHEVSFLYKKQSDLKQPLKPLIVTTGAVVKPADGHAQQYSVKHDENQENCLMPTRPGVAASEDGYAKDKFGQKFISHWVVKPGREVTRTNVTGMLKIPYNTKIHYLFVHVHPFAESMELRDLTANSSVIKIKIKQYADKIGLLRTEHFTSVEGLPIFKDHEYEMISVYNNTSGTNQDAMATMQLFLLDKEFDAATISNRPLASETSP